MAGAAEAEGPAYELLLGTREAAASVQRTRICCIDASRTRLNCVFIASLVSVVFGLSIWYFAEAGKAITASSLGANESNLFVICFNTTVAATFVFVLVLTVMDKTPMTVNYKVMGRPDIAAVPHAFRHFGRFTTFTLWCNTVGVAYFACAAAVGIIEFRGARAPICLKEVTVKLWEVTFPMAFLVNLVVTFALIPGIKKQGHFEKLYYILTWRPQMLHNGFVLAAAIEAAVACPPLVFADFPTVVCFGTVYVVFAAVLFARTGIFHYFFMDPRFKHAPLAIVGLIMLLFVLHCCGVWAIAAAAHSWLAGALLIVCALGTCTWRDAAATPPTTMPPGGGESHA